jgi:signal transduction histidine kinase
LAHELRTPLNLILGWTKLLKAGRVDADRTRQAIDIIERNAQLQTQLVEDLLDVSRILQGKLTLNANTIDLGAVASAAIDTVRLAANAKSIGIQFDRPPASLQVLGNATRWQQVVWNLLSNAVKFTPNGGQI